METNELIERYVHEVGRHLPGSNREDIKLELRSLLLDTIEEQTADSEQPPSTKMVAEYLKEFGRPEVIAANYFPEGGLIGPQVFPYYRLVLTIVLSVIGALHALGLIFLLIQNGMDNFIQNFIGVLTSFGQSGIMVFGIVTLIFAGLERLDISEFETSSEKTAEWDPYQLPPIEDPDRIQRFEILFGIFFSVLFIIAFNFFYDRIGFIDLAGDERGIVPLLAPEFRAHIPWLTASFALDALVKLIAFFQRRWNKVTRLAQVAVGIFGLYVMYRILVSDIITVVPFFTTMAKIGIIVVIIIETFELLNILVRLLIGRPISPKGLFRSRVV